MFGLGPLEDLMRDPSVTDILVNGPAQVYVERHGTLTSSHVTFRDDEHLMTVIHRIAANVGRRIDEGSPRASRTARASTRSSRRWRCRAAPGAAVGRPAPGRQRQATRSSGVL